MRPIVVGDLVLYVSDALGVRVLGVVTQVMITCDAYMDPFYRISWNHPSYEKMDSTVYDMKQVLMWRECFLRLEKDL